MAYETSVSGRWTLAHLEGRVDGQTAPRVEAWARTLLEESGRCLALDLSKVNYVSSAGLRVFLGLFRDCQAPGGDFALVAPTEAVREVLEITGFATALPIVAKVDELPA